MLVCAFALAVAIAVAPLGQAGAAEICVVLAPQAAPAERSAAEELAGYLRQIHPRDRFALGEELPPSGLAILLGSVSGDPRLKALLAEKPTEAESYVVTTARSGQLGIIAGADTPGVIYGVYALLEKLGCGFYLSCDAVAPARREAFSFDGWQLADRPLVRDRFVFNWHNFLSGCSTWNLPEWKAWILQSQKQGYNAVMVHAYGNNPMVSFTFNGKTKPVGYLSTTVKGRDWLTMHVNDVRRLWGGEVFGQPVFGAEAAMVPDDQRAAAAQRLMQEVFAYAGQREMGVFFADDVDTLSANPQDLIRSLPPEARFVVGSKAGPVWLANPQTPAGYRFYKAQVASLLKTYPQITCLVVWFRDDSTPWMDMKVAELPAAWQAEYRAELAKTPQAAKFWRCHNLFAVGKIVRAFDRALKELGHDRVQLATGTWDFEFLPAADLFLPREVKFIGLDYGILHDNPQLGTAQKRQALARVGGHRQVVPVIWAQHDDGNYLGRPYTPFPEFHAKLAEAKAGGFGIIHWTTRPLDLYFASHIKQVWKNTEDQPLRATCGEMAARSFGVPAREDGRVPGTVGQRCAQVRPRDPGAHDRPAIDRYPAGPCRLPRAAEARRSRRCLAAHSPAARALELCSRSGGIHHRFPQHSGRFPDGGRVVAKGRSQGRAGGDCHLPSGTGHRAVRRFQPSGHDPRRAGAGGFAEHPLAVALRSSPPALGP